ncbi:hypothetical protein CspeluHIS016_0802910 [Cutaneotrichosporon spelunceum]|uniref:Uncharacterized protein n=1 Tax=Cutaneotrichosporon spelunceum TaxID=1672016 RepID=A0AAD3TZD9_9TREE|nr:hypothetical protein CspeluHIS016_0802910 [Cutaneotrichosporon spelunceum]
MPIAQPESWKNIAGAPIHEGFVLMALSALDGLVDRRYLPSQRHVQLLLHLATDTEAKTEDLHRAPSPLSILYRYLDLFGPDLLPLLPQLHKGATDYDDARTPDWLAWRPNGDLERSVRRRVLESTKHGIWVFLSQPLEKNEARKKRKKRGGDSDDEEETRGISDDGWDVLQWLVALWSTSLSALLQQLHPPASVKLQYDDAGVVLAAVRAAFLPTDPPTPFSSIPARRKTAAKLLSFVIDLARPPKSPFHPQSLVLSLVTLFRASAAHIPALSRAITDWNARAYILAVVLEDAAGVRKQREEARRFNVGSRSTSRAPSVSTRATRATVARSSSATPADDGILSMMSIATPFQAPSVDYALNLLALDGDDRSPVLAAELISLLVANVPEDGAWQRLGDDFIAEHNAVLGRVLVMARKRADIACGRVSTIMSRIIFEAPDEPMDLDATQSTVPLTGSQLDDFSGEEEDDSQRPAGLLLGGGSASLTYLTSPPDAGEEGNGESDNDDDESQFPAETQPLGKVQRAHFDGLQSDEGESQLPAETLPLTEEQRAQFATEDDNDLEMAVSDPEEDDLESSKVEAEQTESMECGDEGSQLPDETLPLTAAQRAELTNDPSDEESQSAAADSITTADPLQRRRVTAPTV